MPCSPKATRSGRVLPSSLYYAAGYQRGARGLSQVLSTGAAVLCNVHVTVAGRSWGEEDSFERSEGVRVCREQLWLGYPAHMPDNGP